MDTEVKGWLVDVVVGGALGMVVGWVVAVNVVIFAGIDLGYEASITEVFRDNRLVGIVNVAILVAGPVIGVAVARIQRSRRRPNG